MYRTAKRWKWLCSLFVILFSPIKRPSPVKGEGLELETNEMTLSSNIELWKQIVTIFLVLFLIIGIMVLLMKIVARKDMPWMKNRAVYSLGGIHLGQHKSLQVIDLGESIYVVGVGEDVHLIDKIDQKEEMEKIRARFEGRIKGSEFEQGGQMESFESSSFHKLIQKKLGHVTTRGQKWEEVLSDQSDRGKDG